MALYIMWLNQTWKDSQGIDFLGALRNDSCTRAGARKTNPERKSTVLIPIYISSSLAYKKVFDEQNDFHF